jgi:stringent starvation protein B
MLETFGIVHIHATVDKLFDPFMVARQDGGIVTLSVGPHATPSFDVVDGNLEFTARFDGTPYPISIPATAVIGLSAFNRVGDDRAYYPIPEWETTHPTQTNDKETPKPTLRIVK